MAQHDYVIANGTGAAVRSDLNGALAAIVSNNSGATEPTPTYAYQWWADTTTGLLKIRNAANNAWITVGTLASANLGLLSSGGTITAALGSASTPGITFTGDTNTGIYSPGADQVAISTNGTQRLAVDTAATTSTLPVVHPLGAVGTPSITFTGDLNTGIWSPAADTVAASTGGSERLRIDSSGRVGIGSNAPDTTLTVGGTNAAIRVQPSNVANAQIFLRHGSLVNNSGLEADSSGALGLYANGSERARIDSSGRLLVGTSSAPSAGVCTVALQGNSGSSTDGAVLNLQRGVAATGMSSGDNLGFLRFGDNAGNIFAEIKAQTDAASGTNDYPGRLVFSTTADGASSPTERMRIRQNGSTDIYSSDYGLATRVSAAAGTSVAIYYGSYGATSTTTGTVSYQVLSNGNVQNTNNSYGAYSDIKLKENIIEAGSQWDDIKALQVRKYNFKEGQTHTQIGLVAQEVELVSPGLVSETPDRDEEGNDLGTVTKSVNYSVLYMKAVKALQEAMERIEQLEAKVAALEAA